VDKKEAMEILRLYRPGTDNDPDPRLAEALQLARQDPELAHWFEAHCGFYTALRSKLKEIPVPADLSQKILRAEAVRRRRIVPWNKILPPLAAAATVVFLATALWFHILRVRSDNFPDARERLAKEPQRGYVMTLISTNLDAIHSYLLAKQCPDYQLTKPLAKLDGLGCADLQWHDRRVSMVCLKDKQGKDGKPADLYLFAMEKANFRNAPLPGEMKFEKIHRLMTASWTQGDKLYILAGPGEEADLKRYLD
jgi:hypothetical protein